MCRKSQKVGRVCNIKTVCLLAGRLQELVGMRNNSQTVCVFLKLKRRRFRKCAQKYQRAKTILHAASWRTWHLRDMVTRLGRESSGELVYQVFGFFDLSEFTACCARKEGCSRLYARERWKSCRVLKHGTC